MHANHLSEKLQQMAVCLLLSGSAAASQRESETAQLFATVQLGVQQFSTMTAANQSIESSKRKIRAVIETIKALENMCECTEHAAVFLAGDEAEPGQLVSSVQLQIFGGLGDAYLSFVSATNLSAVVAAINTLQQQTGVVASISDENSHRIQLQSILAGSSQFVTVKQFSGVVPIVFPQANGWTGMYEWTDYGCAFGAPACAQSAEVYLSTNANLELQGHGSLVLEVIGNLGQQQFTFYSGTTQANIIAAINTFSDEIGVTTKQCEEDHDRVEFNSTLVGSDAWVRVKQVNYPKYPYNLLAATPTEIVSTNDLLDEGKDAVNGDVDCDDFVGIADLSAIIDHWGKCVQPPAPCPYDLTGNAIVDVDDLLRVINNWSAFD